MSLVETSGVTYRVLQSRKSYLLGQLDSEDASRALSWTSVTFRQSNDVIFWNGWNLTGRWELPNSQNISWLLRSTRITLFAYLVAGKCTCPPLSKHWVVMSEIMKYTWQYQTLFTVFAVGLTLVVHVLTRKSAILLGILRVLWDLLSSVGFCGHLRLWFLGSIKGGEFLFFFD